MVNTIIAFVPVRGGSKSIPLKNIKEFCGKPLVYWNLHALQQVSSIDKIVVATDSDDIELTVKQFNFSKVLIYRRLADNATDAASTESVMLEYINCSKLAATDAFMLVQATSPLTQCTHYEQGIDLYREGKYDSVLTCVRSKRFFWNADGTSKNYNYKSRPRRQDFEGELMENGAFYISSVKNIVQSGNRLSGKIGIYEMPDYTSFELDEADDWAIMEMLMKRHVLNTSTHANIKLFLSDVDGVLTDAGMYYSDKGEELKKFNTHDGMGFQLLREAGIKTGIITSESTLIVEKRAQKLKIDYLYQGQKHGGKLNAALEICEKEGVSMAETAYIGDDINCYELLTAVGVAACPCNATAKIKNIPGINILSKSGGEGAVREFIEFLLNRQ